MRIKTQAIGNNGCENGDWCHFCEQNTDRMCSFTSRMGWNKMCADCALDVLIAANTRPKVSA